MLFSSGIKVKVDKIFCVSCRAPFKNLESKIETVLFKRVIFLTCTKDIQHYKGRKDYFERKISLSLLNNTVFYNLTPYQ